MKLLHLELQAFGSFKGKEQINFNSFDSSKIFLISGKTGSGKTTIFDAISYCLFGKLTGQFKSDDMIRSHYADDNVETYVKLRFLEQNKEYEIYRKPAYKISTRKTPTLLQATLTSITDDKVLATKANETTKLVEEILKFNYDQFRQIVVLPQGEFIKILNSNSNEKEKLLSSLLNTTIYNNIELKLKEENFKLEQKLTTVKGIFDNILNKYEVNNIEELKVLQTDNKTKYDNIKFKYDIYYNDISKLKLDIQNYNNLNNLKLEEIRLKEKLNNFDSKKEEINKYRKDVKILTTIKELKGYYDKLDTYNELLSKAIDDYNQDNKLFNEYDIKYKRINELELNLINLKENEKNLIDKLNEIINLENEDKVVKQLKININSLKDDIKDIENELIKLNNNDYESRLENLNNEIILNNEFISNYDPYYLTNLEKEYENYNKNSNDYNKYQELIKDNENYNEIINTLTLEVNKLEESLDEINEIRKHNVLETFIDYVKTNEPCPLCGSLEHPNIIKRINNSASDEDIKELEDKINKFKLNLNSKNTIIENNNKLIEEYKSIINFELLNSDISILLSKINNAKEESIKYNNALAKINTLNSDKNELLKLISNNTKLVTNKTNQITIINNNITFNNKRIIDYNTKLLEFTSGVSLDVLKTKYNDEYKVITSNINSLNNEINTIKNNYNNYKRSLEKLDLNIKNYKLEINKTNDNIKSIMINNNIDNDIYITYIDRLNEFEYLNNIVYEYDLEYHKLSSLIKSNEDKLLNYEIVNIDTLELNLKELEESFDNIKSEYDSILEIYSNISNDYNSLVKLNNSNKEVINRYEIVNELYRLTNGTYSKVSKITLQKYVLGIILDKIILYANTYLKSFTSSRYQLKRVIDESSSNRGLELAVIDAQTGLERSVGSLSGGESFMCALALAIGMSEGISSMSGGIKLENIFIDEGFGSLDNEALDNAIEALMILASNGRMIGIISHVSEIKNRITNVIEVVKTKTGSKIIN